MIIPEFNRTYKFLYEVDELRAIFGHMLGASKVQIPDNNFDNLHSMVENGTLEIMDPQELLTNVTTGLVVLLSIGIGFLRGTIAVMVILVKGNTFPTNVKVHPVDLDFTRAFIELINSNEMALVLTTLFLLFKLGCDPLELVSKFTPVEESTGLLETTFVEDVVLMGVFPDEGICSQYQNEVNELRAKKLARNANPLALVATAQASQDPYYQTPRSHRSSAPSLKPSILTRSHTATRHKGKEIAKPITPLFEIASEEDSDPEQAQRDKDMQKNLALIAKYFKKIYKPTNNNLRTSSNSKNKKVDTAPRNMDILPRNAESQKGLRTPYTDEEVDEQELEAHYSYMAKIQEVLTADSGTNSDSVEHVQNETRYNVFVNHLQHSEQSEYVSNTCLVETDDSNVTLDSPDMCEDDIQNEQNDVESDDERVVLANLIAKLKLGVDENKKTQKQLKKANTTLAQELKECKTILTKQAEFEKFKAFNDCTIDYDKLKCKLNEALGQLAHKDTVIREDLKTKAYELSVVKEKHDELMKQSLLTKSRYEGLVKQKTKVITDLKLKEEHDIEKMLSMEKQLKLLNEIVYKRSQSIQTIHMMAPKSDSLKFVHELKQEMHADLKYVESIEKEIDELESDKAEFSDMYDVIFQECVSKDVMCSCLMSLFDLDVLDELQCIYLHKVKECDCFTQKLSKQTESVSKKVHTELLQHFAKVEKHSISFEIALQNCKEQKLIEKGKGKSVDTKFDRTSVVRQPNAQRIPKPSVLGKPEPFSDSLERKYFPKTKSVPKANVSKGLSKPVTTQTLRQTAKKAVSNTDVLKPGIYRIDNRIAHIIGPQLPQTVRNTNLRVSTSTGVNHKPTVSRPQLKSNQLRDKVVQNTSQMKIVQLILFIVDSGCTKHMMNNLKLLCNFVEKFLGTVCFGNDQFAPILGYGDLVQGNVTINRVYYVEGLNHNLFLVGQFCDADLEVAFRKSTCFVRDLRTLFLRSKDETPEVLKEFLTIIQRNLQARNGIVERRNRTLVEAARTMLSASQLLLFFWAKAIATACYTQNRSIIISTHDKTPYHINNDRKPSIKHLYIFGCICYITRDGENLDKMKEKWDQCILVGYSTQSKGYRVYNKRTRMIVESIYIHFDEIKEVSETSVANNTSGLIPQRQKASDFYNPDPVPERQDVYS
nr:retrovirus-related Pol polyprotein from transposon TNT 1-94 [Tanacetum cinerariifolium]